MWHTLQSVAAEGTGQIPQREARGEGQASTCHETGMWHRGQAGTPVACQAHGATITAHKLGRERYDKPAHASTRLQQSRAGDDQHAASLGSEHIDTILQPCVSTSHEQFPPFKGKPSFLPRARSTPYAIGVLLTPPSAPSWQRAVGLPAGSPVSP
jgi:hypothetical protein